MGSATPGDTAGRGRAAQPQSRNGSPSTSRRGSTPSPGPSGARTRPPSDGGIPVAVHIRKMAGNEGVLTTRDLEGVTRILNPEDINHQTIVCSKNGNDTAWRWTRDGLIEYARQAGGTFGPSRRNGTDC